MEQFGYDTVMNVVSDYCILRFEAKPHHDQSNDKSRVHVNLWRVQLGFVRVRQLSQDLRSIYPGPNCDLLRFDRDLHRFECDTSISSANSVPTSTVLNIVTLPIKHATPKSTTLLRAEMPSDDVLYCSRRLLEAILTTHNSSEVPTSQ